MCVCICVQEEYVIINVPPVFMFQAKVFQPPRLCAIYRRTDDSKRSEP